MIKLFPSKAFLFLYFATSSLALAQNNTKLYAKIHNPTLSLYAVHSPIRFISGNYDYLRFDLDSIGGLGFQNQVYEKVNDSIVPIRKTGLYNAILSNDNSVNYFQIFIQPQDSLHIEVKSLEEVSFYGRGAKENQVLYEFQKKFNFKQIENQLLISDKKPTSIFALKTELNILHKSQLDFLVKSKGKSELNNSFEDWLNLEITSFQQYILLRYLIAHQDFLTSFIDETLLLPRQNPHLQLLSINYNLFIINYLEYINQREAKKIKQENDKFQKLGRARLLLKDSPILNYIEVQLIFELFDNYPNIEFIEAEYKSIKAKLVNKILLNYLEETYKLKSPVFVGRACPSFSLNNDNDTLISLKDFSDQVIVIDFWASWCKPCIEGFDKLKKIKSQNKEIKFVLISIDKDKKNWLNAIKKYELSDFVNLIVEENLGFRSPTAKKFGLNAIPATFIIDQNQLILANDMTEASEEDWRIFLDEALKIKNKSK